jgi:tetratricopeptide (TPR) repeat protein
MLLVGLAVCLLSNLGCQSFCPFAKKTRESLVSARQWASGGLEALHNGRLETAKGLLSRAVEQNPNDASVRENLARTLHKSGDTEQAISQMQHAVELSKGDPRMIVELGEMYLDTGQWWHARNQVDLALNANHRFAPAWALSGKTEKAKGNYSQALADFQRALGFNPEMPQVQMQIVDTYQRMGNSHRALSAIEQILNKLPSDKVPESVVLAKSVAMIDLDLVRPAIDLLQTASNKKHASSVVFVRLGQAQLLAGQVSQARMTLNRGKLAYPNLVVFDELISNLQSAEQRVASAGNLIVR